MRVPKNYYWKNSKPIFKCMFIYIYPTDYFSAYLDFIGPDDLKQQSFVLETSRLTFYWAHAVCMFDH